LLNALHRLYQAIVARLLKARHGDHWPEAHGGPAWKAETQRLSGLALWSIAHIYFLIGFRNRLLVAMT
jgi:hypothetical protein